MIFEQGTYTKLELAEVQASLEHTINMLDLSNSNKPEEFERVVIEMKSFLFKNALVYDLEIPVAISWRISNGKYAIYAIADGKEYFFGIENSKPIDAKRADFYFKGV